MSEFQFVLLSIIATSLVFVLNEWKKRTGKAFHRGWLTTFLFGVSLALAVAWQLPIFPALPVYAGEVAVFAGAIVAFLFACIEAVAPLVGFATLIYNTLGKLVFDKIGEQWFKLMKA